MNKQELANYLATTRVSVDRIEELLTNFLNSELAARRPKIDLLGAGIVEPAEPENIKPEDMVSGDWYLIVDGDYKWVVKYNHFSHTNIYCDSIYAITEGYNHGKDYIALGITDTIRKATKEEVLKYFPDEQF
jgi:hypothetical protein